MTKQEKIKEVIASSLASIDGHEWETLADNLRGIYLFNAGRVAYDLHSQGVVIRIDDNLPVYYGAVLEMILRSVSEYHNEFSDVSCGCFESIVLPNKCRYAEK